MFVVEGVSDLVVYGVAVGDPDQETGWGIVAGSPSAIQVLKDHEGEAVGVTPVGPFYDVASDSPEGILACLSRYTQVLRVTGDVPDLSGGTSPEGVDH